MTLTSDIRLLLVRELEGMMREVGAFPNDETLWRTPAGVTNSAGNLALHLAGNLQHFVGAMLGHTEYVRNRELEFSTRSGTREDVQQALRDTITTVTDTLARMNNAALSAPMPGAPMGMVTRTDLFLLHLVAHAAFHLGQAGYVRRIVCGDATSANPLPLSVLASPA